MQKRLLIAIVLLSLSIVSCSTPSGGGERVYGPANGEIASQPVRYPFSETSVAAESPAPKGPPIVVQRVAADEAPDEVKPTERTAPPPVETVSKAPREKELSPAEKAAAELESAINDTKAARTARETRVATDQPRRLTLKQAVDITLERNLRLKQQSEVIAEAEARLREKQNEYGPRLQFDYTVYTWDGLFVNTKISDPDIPAEGTGRAEMTLLVPVWFARRQREAAVRQAMEEIKVGKQDYERKRNEIVVDVVKRYFDVLEAEEALRHTGKIVEHNRRRLATLKVLEREGKILKNRVMLGEKFTASADEELHYRRSERDLADSRFKKALNLPDAERIVLAKPQVIVLPAVPTIIQARDRMRTANPMLRRLHHERMSAYWTGRVRHYEEPHAHIAVRYGVSFPKYREFTDDFLTVGLTVNWPIAKFRLDRAKRDQARHRVRQLELEERIIRDDLDLSTMETHAAYLKALRRLQAKHLAVQVAEENLRLSKVFRRYGTVEGQLPEDVFQVQVNEIALLEGRMDDVKVKYEALGLLADLYDRMNATDELVKFLSALTQPSGETVEAQK